MSNTERRKIELRDFFLALSTDERDVFASKCGTTTGHIKHIYSGNRTCSERIAIEMDKYSSGAVSCDKLCPDMDFNYLRKQERLDNF